MAFSFQRHTGDGVTKTYQFTFQGAGVGYYDEDTIRVYVNGTLSSDYTLTGPNQITFGDAPVDNSDIFITREPVNTTPYSDFSRGNAFTQPILNHSFEQQLYLTHRILDGFKEEGYYEKQDLDMGGHRISGILAGSSPDDVATVGQISALSGLITSKYREVIPTGGKTILDVGFDIDVSSQNFMLYANGVLQYDAEASDSLGNPLVSGVTQYINMGGFFQEGVEIIVYSSIPASLGA